MKEGGVNHLDPDPQITTILHISGIGAQQKKKKMAEKIAKKTLKCQTSVASIIANAKT